MKKINVLGINFDNQTLKEFKNDFLRRLYNHDSTLIVTANPEIVMAAQENPEFMKIIQEDADYVTADGIGVVKASQMLKTPLKERVTGYDLFTWFLRVASDKELRVYLIGAKPDIIHAVQAKISRSYRGIRLVGAEDGYFHEDLDIVARRITKTNPDMVFAALGYPKQEQLLAILRRNLVPAIMMGVGGSFDVFSGMVKRAPETWQQMHLEWFYRLLKDPKRIKRMTVLPKFIWQVRKSRK